MQEFARRVRVLELEAGSKQLKQKLATAEVLQDTFYLIRI